MSKDYKAIVRADVYQNEQIAGKLERTGAGSLFRYDPKFYDLPGGISFRMPFASREFVSGGGSIPAFFAGLLPEGARLTAIKESVKTSLDDHFSLLLAAGPDFVGDVSIVPEGEPLHEVPALVDASRLSSTTFAEVWKQATGSRSLEERSVSGIHQKVSAQMVTLPIRGDAKGREYLLKLNPDDKPTLVANEEFFMRLAKKCGISVAKVRLVSDQVDAPGLLVERFDSKLERSTKLHVEDACQLLDKYPATKYALSFSEVIEGISRFATAPRVESLKCLRLYAYSYLIANGDLHGKNISLLTTTDGRVELAPAYDVLSTLPYGDQKMALRIEGRDDNIKIRDLVAAGKRAGIPERAIQDMLKKLTQRLANLLGEFDSLPFAKRDIAFLIRTTEKRLSDLTS
jgi:serine/threonine-protein kinase HipA